MHILVTNDDGVFAPGLLALAQALREVGEISVVAPDHNWSVSGHVKTLSRPLRAKPVELADGTPALASDGAPSDCVALGVMGLVDRSIDLVVSGINPNANVGHDVTYSGTVTAAMEAVISGIPALAVSLDAPEYYSGPQDFSAAAGLAAQVAELISHRGLPANTLLNMNVPYLKKEAIKGIRVSRQGMRIYRDELVKREDPRGRPYYWIGGEAPTGVLESGTDFGDLAEGYVSLTPIQLDLTAYSFLETLKTWPWQDESR